MTLSQTLLACGDALHAAAEAEDVERVAALAAERGSLVERLLETDPASYPAAEAAALRAQQHALDAVLARHEEALRAVLGGVAVQRQAHASYGPAPARAPILRTLHG